VDTIAYTGTFNFIFTHLDLAWTTFEAIGAGQLAMLPVGRDPCWRADKELERFFSREEAQGSEHAHPV
jgi:hypothetical protein